MESSLAFHYILQLQDGFFRPVKRVRYAFVRKRLPAAPPVKTWIITAAWRTILRPSSRSMMSISHGNTDSDGLMSSR